MALILSAGHWCGLTVLELPFIVPEGSDRETALFISHVNDTNDFKLRFDPN